MVTRRGTLQRVIFILIESGMALFSIQVARLVVTIMLTDATYAAYFFIRGIHEILNVIIISVIATLFYSLLITSASVGYYTYHYFGAGINGIVFSRREFHGGS